MKPVHAKVRKLSECVRKGGREGGATLIPLVDAWRAIVM